MPSDPYSPNLEYRRSAAACISTALLLAASLIVPPQARAQGTAPSITGAPQVTSNPVSGTTYGTGETIEFSVTFDAAVTVTGAPRFGFRLKDSGVADSAATLGACRRGTITLGSLIPCAGRQATTTG